MTLKRALLAITGAALVCLIGLAGTPAHADQFRYWTYWTSSSDGWSFSPLGPAFRPADEAVVEGWRFEIAGVDASKPPRMDARGAFDAACGAVPARDGLQRIAVVIDFGTASDAPPEQDAPEPLITCAQIDIGGTGFDALREVTDIRSERGFVCGLGGFPATGCGREPVETTEQSPAPSPSASRSAAPSTAVMQPSPAPLPETSPPASQSRTRSHADAQAGGTRSAGPAAPSMDREITSQSAVADSPDDGPSPRVQSASTAADGNSTPTALLAIAVLIAVAVLGSLAWVRARGRR